MPSATVSAGRNIECRWPMKPVAVAADGEQPAEVQPEDEQQHDPEPEGREAEADERHGADDVVDERSRRSRRSAASGTAISTENSVAEADQPERHRQPLAARAGPADAVEERLAEVAVREPAHELPYWTGSGSSSPHSWWSSATRAGVAWLPEDRPRRVARHEVDQEEDEDRDAERDRHDLRAAGGRRSPSRLMPRSPGDASAAATPSQTSSRW